jgi:adenine-specific DNA-methyltransferase
MPETSPSLPARTKMAKPARAPAQPELTWPGKTALADVALIHPVERNTADARLPTLFEGSNLGVVAHGDNKQVMSELLEGSSATASLGGTVKLCYLDPPYNTGSRFSTYSDAMRTDDWLTSIRDRLVQIRALLASDGSVWLHLDDSHQHHARVLLDEVFGREAFVATIIWEKRRSRDNRKAFSSSHDYIHVYAPLGRDWKLVRNGLPNDAAFVNPDNDKRGPWRSVPLSAQAGHATAAQFYVVVTPTGLHHLPPPGRCWTYSEPRFKQLLDEGRIYWPDRGNGRPRLKRFVHEVEDLAPSTLWTSDFAGDTSRAKKELLSLFPNHSVFDTPKPEKLLERIIEIATDPEDLVLDPYLGSGTTAVVATRLERKFIGIEHSERVIREIVIPRLHANEMSDRITTSLRALNP